jgi:hypothetical protein
VPPRTACVSYHEILTRAPHEPFQGMGGFLVPLHDHASHSRPRGQAGRDRHGHVVQASSRRQPLPSRGDRYRGNALPPTGSAYVQMPPLTREQASKRASKQVHSPSPPPFTMHYPGRVSLLLPLLLSLLMASGHAVLGQEPDDPFAQPPPAVNTAPDTCRCYCCPSAANPGQATFTGPKCDVKNPPLAGRWGCVMCHVVSCDPHPCIHSPTHATRAHTHT